MLQRFAVILTFTCSLVQIVSAQDRILLFDTSALGEKKSIETWGLDTAWLSETHIRRGVIFMGKPQVDVIRFSFTGDWPLVGGNLGPEALAEFNTRMGLVDTYTESDTALYLNNDSVAVDPSFLGGDGVNPAVWAQLITLTKQRCEDQGRTVLSIAPFNEPDYSTWQGNVTRFGDVCWQLRNTFASETNGIRLMGGNTLNNDVAASWYDPLNGFGFLEEGNTHQLAGNFDSYVNFYQTVEANGDWGCNDELHNVMEAMVGAEYGMDAAIWWGTAERARGEFVKASDGHRLAYAEHRPNWTAASVYRAPDGKIQAFVGESERQARPTTYQFFSKDRPVFYNGYGPQHSFEVSTTGGDGYMTAAHRSAEKLINITWGEDIQPVIDGTYYLVARHSKKVIEVAGASASAGANIQQNNYTGAIHQQWEVRPLPASTGGDYSYFTITNANSGGAMDLVNFSYENGANLHQWDNATGVNQQYYFEYVEDGWFVIRNRWSGKCVDIAANSTANGANVHQWDYLEGTNQQWRFLPVGSALEFNAPAPPTGFTASANEVSVTLSWNANVESDLAGYDLYRKNALNSTYELIARGITETTYVDSSANQNQSYSYRLKAVDHSLNQSNNSITASATPSGLAAVVASYPFNQNGDDASGNELQSELQGTASFGQGIQQSALSLDGTEGFATLPPTAPHFEKLTISTWVFWKGGNDWQRIFDFGNQTNQYLFLTPQAGGTMRFVIKNEGNEQILETSALPTGQWTHVALTLGENSGELYLNGVLADSQTITITPSEFKPVLNYLGKSQFAADPYFNGLIDDFEIFNYKLTLSQIQELAGSPTPEESNTQAFWNFEDGLDGQSFTPAGSTDGSGGSYDTINEILMRGFNETYGPSWSSATPPNGGALSMNNVDGSQDGYVTEGALHNWAPQEWTIECTILLEELTGWKTMIGRDGSSHGLPESDFYLQNNGIDNRFRISYQTSNAQRWAIDGNYNIEANRWYALAVRSDGATLSMWLDNGNGYQQIGALDISSQTPAQNAFPLSDFTWTFGRGWYNGAFVDHIDGRMDNIRFSNTALTPEEMIPLDANPPQNLTTKAYWDFEDGLDAQPFTPLGAINGSGGSYDTFNNILMRGYNEVYGPSWSSETPPNGGTLAMNHVGNSQDGYVTEGALHNWSPEEWTIECTVLLGELSGWKTLIGRDGSSHGISESDFYLQKNGIDDRFRIRYQSANGQDWTLDGDYSVQPNTWYAIAAKSDGVELSLWLDDGSGYQKIGALDISSQTPAQNALPLSAFTWTFGRGWYNGGFVDHIDGRMDNIRFSDVALPASDLISLVSLNPLEEWRQRYFGINANTGIAASDADPDLDGYNNLLEYAFGSDPTVADPSKHPSLEISESSFYLTYQQSLSDETVSLVIEQSSDLENWSPALGNESLIFEDGTIHKKRFTPLSQLSDRSFLRIRVVRP